MVLLAWVLMWISMSGRTRLAIMKTPGSEMMSASGPDLRKLLKIRLHAGQVAVVGQDIGRDVHLDAALVGKGDALFDLLICKILRLGPEPEGLSAKINGVSPVDDRRL